MSAFQVEGLREFAAAIDAEASQIAADVRKASMDAGVRLKNSMRKQLRARPHFKKAALDVDFDVIERNDEIEIEVGPSIGRGRGHAGGLAHIAYFGGSNGGGGTVRDPQLDLDEEEPRFLTALEELAGKRLE